MSDQPEKIERPLSPHLQVYKPQMTSVLSILHRMTGAALSIGLVMIVWWLLAAATGEQAYDTFMSFAGHPVGILMIFGWSVALFYHMCNGIRHLLWDMGYLFKLKNAFRAGYVVLTMTVLLTAIVWWVACPWAQ